jgi:hypothetical protein
MRPTTSRFTGGYTLNVTGDCEGDCLTTITGKYGGWKVCSEYDMEQVSVYEANATGMSNNQYKRRVFRRLHSIHETCTMVSIFRVLAYTEAKM